MSIKQDALINKHTLDDHWEDQTSLMDKWTSKHVDAISIRDDIKTKIELFYADTSLKIRKNPEKWEISKVTDKVVDAVIIIQTEYQQLLADLLQANNNVNAFKGGIKTLDSRQASIEHLVKLYKLNYWSVPKIKQVEKKAYGDVKAAKHTSALAQNSRLKKRRKN